MALGGVAPPLVGNASIAGTLKAIVDMLSDVSCLLALREDWPLLQAKLDIERTLLLQWVTLVKLFDDDDYHPCLDELDTHQKIFDLLHDTQTMLMEKDQLENRFGIMTYEQLDSLPDATYLNSYLILSKSRLEQFNIDFARRNLRVRHLPTDIPSTTRILRIVTCPVLFESFIRHLRKVVHDLNKLGYHETFLECTAEMAKEDVKNCKTMDDVRMVRDVTKEVRITINREAEELLVLMARRRVMNNLWFEGMHERRVKLNDPHPETFLWSHAPQQPDVGWDSLADWLESGSDLYWVCGKAGAGKSTFLKHVYDHPETRRRLDAWGGKETVSLGSFFFWKMGTHLQKCRDGMSRAILYQILEAVPSAIPALMPNMWKCAYEGCLIESHQLLPSPGSVQWRDAFDKMAEEGVLDKRFCFFVDGLDEYAGDGARAVELLRQLCTTPKIKVVVSSRPERVFEESLADTPQLRLDQLTDQDVLQYVQDKTDSHRYMRTLRDVDEARSRLLVETLAEKAFGVFLWTVLATKLFLQGFDAFEAFYELEQRIEEIPTDLHQLFAYILKQVDPRYLNHVARMLRICQRSKQSRSAEGERGWVRTVGLAAASASGLDFQNFDLHSARTLLSRHRQCVVLEQRLANRCGGLLEVIRAEVDKLDDCFCGTPKSHPHHDILIDSSIEFVHRTAFEWFNGLGSYVLSSLGLQEDNSFNEDAALASMSWQQSRIARELGATFGRSDTDMSNCLLYVGRTDRFSPQFANNMLLRIHDLVAETRRKRGQNWHFSFCCNAEGVVTERLETLYFAVGMGMVNFVKYYLEKNTDGESLAELEVKHKMRWWKVASDRTLITYFLEPYYKTMKQLPPPGPMLLYLATSGCEVPEAELRRYVVSDPMDEPDALRLLQSIF
ncbi:hypothetical protein LCI18_002888 [Fusarium solani-melongenae]|uniref:Uncharacterized protein n=1 Tax=Fusarium solani subsp. cucurbitae TaxID=2747967 RepID=A0ACD3YVR2_FUSSC|nr:hypothetical protein LCI18_002888 [Fusarium solani-melongenae]